MVVTRRSGPDLHPAGASVHKQADLPGEGKEAHTVKKEQNSAEGIKKAFR